jgi:hypothetical protein
LTTSLAVGQPVVPTILIPECVARFGWERLEKTLIARAGRAMRQLSASLGKAG